MPWRIGSSHTVGLQPDRQASHYPVHLYNSLQDLANLYRTRTSAVLELLCGGVFAQ